MALRKWQFNFISIERRLFTIHARQMANERLTTKKKLTFHLEKREKLSAFVQKNEWYSR